MLNMRTRRLIVTGGLLLLGMGAVTVLACALGAGEPVMAAADRAAGSVPESSPDWIVLAWNDLGMHCYNRDFEYLAVLPPYNVLWAQVLEVGDPPRIITTGITVTFSFTQNTTSLDKSDFWDINASNGVQNAQWLFQLPAPLPDNIGLTGIGLAGAMEAHGDHFIADGIPLTEFRDSDPGNPYPYQLATVVVQDASSGVELARSVPVAPVSTEMHCDNCHSDNGDGNEDIATGVVELNILTQHDSENADEYPAGHTGNLVDRRPILCAECHASNALNLPGAGDLPNFSQAMHDQHKDEVTADQAGCYNCHPGPLTLCQRDVMGERYGMTCIDCHGNMQQVAANPSPWLIEPRCDGTDCHPAYGQDQPLYRMSRDHGGIYCEGCHDSPHAIAPSRESNDALKFLALQGHAGPLDSCTVCHLSQPVGAGPHGMIIVFPEHVYLPSIMR